MLAEPLYIRGLLATKDPLVLVEDLQAHHHESVWLYDGNQPPQHLEALGAAVIVHGSLVGRAAP